MSTALLLGVLLCWQSGNAHGQGLVVTNSPAPLGASGAYSSLAALYAQSEAWKAAFKRSPRSACAAGGQTLCSAGSSGDAAAYGQLVVATSPLVYSSADPRDTGGFDFVPAPRDQRPCAACTAFAVAAAAQAAVAAAARVNASAVEPLSAADLLYCSPGAPTTCTAGWTLADVLRQLTGRRIAPEACVPYDPPSLDGEDDIHCGPQCKMPEELKGRLLAAAGGFSYQGVADEWTICQAIRESGAVVSRFDIMSDFREFFADPARSQDVYRPKPGAKVVETHAVIIIGYNLVEGYWLVQNSWGPDWNTNGRFKVRTRFPL
ncbi:MAG: hypothetical protein J3K34DRAFT_105024 [Monoraphidium minutum]|nr:MAG: hypothetical protein J3K34DRAFT_105024 [Monoraphidium minutum]